MPNLFQDATEEKRRPEDRCRGATPVLTVQPGTMPGGLRPIPYRTRKGLKRPALDPAAHLRITVPRRVIISDCFYVLPLSESGKPAQAQNIRIIRFPSNALSEIILRAKEIPASKPKATAQKVEYWLALAR